MRIFVYEWVTAGAVVDGSRRTTVSPSLAGEGWAMLRAVVQDFARLEQRAVQVLTIVDSRHWPPELHPAVEVHQSEQCRDEWETFRRLAAAADCTLVIAPELDDCLVVRTNAAILAGGRLLGPSTEFCRIAANKQATAELLTAAGVPVPPGVRLESWRQWPAGVACPAVLKPIDGAGSTGIELLTEYRLQPRDDDAAGYRLEAFCAGVPVSMAAVCGPAGHVLLPACLQRLSDDGRMSYGGGRCPLSPEYNERAARLVQRALSSLPPAMGYVGFDLVLGDRATGHDDVVIEVNPRLTTSYVGLRHVVRENLAAVMLDVAGGQTVSLSYHDVAVEFDPFGQVTEE